MDEIRYPSTRYSQATPALPPNFTGVLIASPPAISYRERMIVSGVYQLPEQECARIDERLHRALVAVVTVGAGYAVFNPFREAVLFADDDERSAWGRRGYFHFDAMGAARDLYPGDYYAMVSLGRFLSNSIRVRIR